MGRHPLDYSTSGASGFPNTIPRRFVCDCHSMHRCGMGTYVTEWRVWLWRHCRTMERSGLDSDACRLWLHGNLVQRVLHQRERLHGGWGRVFAYIEGGGDCCVAVGWPPVVGCIASVWPSRGWRCVLCSPICVHDRRWGPLEWPDVDSDQRWWPCRVLPCEHDMHGG